MLETLPLPSFSDAIRYIFPWKKSPWKISWFSVILKKWLPKKKKKTQLPYPLQEGISEPKNKAQIKLISPRPRAPILPIPHLRDNYLKTNGWNLKIVSWKNEKQQTTSINHHMLGSILVFELFISGRESWSFFLYYSCSGPNRLPNDPRHQFHWFTAPFALAACC